MDEYHLKQNDVLCDWLQMNYIAALPMGTILTKYINFMLVTV